MNTCRRRIAIAALTAGISLTGQAAEWSYFGNTGPEFWGDLSPTFATCKNGNEQSPIDLGSFANEDDDLENLVHKFNPSPLTVVNNGHTIQINTNENSYTKTEFGEQRLLQFHFHSPSENTLNGQHFPLEAHFVHINNDGVLSVVGIFYEEGTENEALAELLAVAPDHIGSSTNLGDSIDPNLVLGAEKTRSYFRFAGSLTTPPCTEGVRWYVSKTVQNVSHEQIEEFEHLFHGSNSRPVQNINSRELLTTEED